jgi:type IV pilus assembly protein PilV
MLSPSSRRSRVCGFTLIEVLVTIVILLLGLLGVIGLQIKASGVELESYQRGQALSLARDLASRIADSRSVVGAGYLDNTLSSTDGSVYVGVQGSGTQNLGACTSPLSTSTPLAIATYEMCQWALAVQGASEGTSAGAVLGARGCLMRMDTTTSGAIADFYIVAVWRGVTVGAEPLGTQAGETATPASKCASAVSFGTGLRRGVSVRVMVPALS